MTADPKDILLSKIIALVQDLHIEGGENGEAMFLLGSAASSLIATDDNKTWRAFKADLTPATVLDYLGQIDTQGNRLLDEDKVTFAYALQIIGMSLAATAYDDPKLLEGVGLLDDIIETTLINFRNYQSRTTPSN